MALHRNNMQQKLPNNTTLNPTHIAKTSRKHTHSNKDIKCPWCGKTYNALNPLLKHLKIKQQNTTWPIGICPINNQQQNERETWEIILHYNKNLTTKEQMEYTNNKIMIQQQNRKRK